MKYYLLEIWRDVEPQLFGPYRSAEARDKDGIRRKQSDPESGFYKIDSEGTVFVGQVIDTSKVSR